MLGKKEKTPRFDNSGELTKYVVRCERILANYEAQSAEELISEVSEKYVIRFTSTDMFESIKETAENSV